MEIQTIKDGPKNLSIMIKGFSSEDFGVTPVIDIAKFSAPSSGWKGLRLDSAVWAIQEKMGMYLWWEEEMSESALILPLESRNGMRYDEGIPSPRINKGWKGKIFLSSFKTKSEGPVPKAFVIILDFDKQ